MFYHWTIFALDAEERFALSSPAYETGILLLNYSAMVEIDGLEPSTFGLSYYYIFLCPQKILCCSLDYIFIISDGQRIVSTNPVQSVFSVLSLALPSKSFTDIVACTLYINSLH